MLRKAPLFLITMIALCIGDFYLQELSIGIYGHSQGLSRLITVPIEISLAFFFLLILIAADEQTSLMDMYRSKRSGVKKGLDMLLVTIGFFGPILIWYFIKDSYLNASIIALEPYVLTTGSFTQFIFLTIGPMLLLLVFSECNVRIALSRTSQGISRNIGFFLALSFVVMFSGYVSLVTTPFFTAVLYVIYKEIFLHEGIGQKANFESR